MGMMATTHAAAQPAPVMTEDTSMLVTMRVGRQLFAVAVQQVREILKECRMAHIPLAARQITGSINLRGRIVTVVDVRRHLGMDAGDEAASHMFVVVEHRGEYYSLQVDSVGEVLTIPHAGIEKPLANLTPRWREVATGIYRLEHELLIIININTFFAL